jgi:hypothetical protein
MRRASALIKEAKDQEAALLKLKIAIANEMLADAGVRPQEAKGDTWEAKKAALAPLLQKARAAAEAAVAKEPSGPGAGPLRKAGDLVAAGQIIEAIELYRTAAVIASWASSEAAEYVEMRKHAVELLDMSTTAASRKERKALSELEAAKQPYTETSDALRRLNKELEKNLVSLGAVIELDIESEDVLQRGVRNKVRVRLNNNGPVPIHSLELKVEAEAELEVPDVPVRLEAFSSARLELGVRPRNAGELQVRIYLSYMVPATRRRHRLERTTVLSVSN